MQFFTDRQLKLFLDMVAQIVFVGSNGIDEHWKRNSAYSLDPVTNIWQTFVDEGERIKLDGQTIGSSQTNESGRRLSS